MWGVPWAPRARSEAIKAPNKTQRRRLRAKRIGSPRLTHSSSLRQQVLDGSWEWLKKLGDILTYFAQSDPLVKERMAIENVCLGILNPFISLSLTNQLTSKASFKRFSNLIVVLLKCVRALSVEPKTLKKLDREQAIVTLMPLLEQKAACV